MTKLLASYGFYPLRGAEDEGGSGAASSGGTALTRDDPAPVVEGGASENLYGKDGEGKPAEEGKAEGDGKEGGEAWAEYVEDPDKSSEENAAAKAEHDKTKPAEDDKGEKKDEKKDEAPIDPTSYEFEVPEGFELDPSIDKEFREFAAERKLSNDDVKALTDMQLRMYAKQSEQHAATVEKWGEDLKSDKEIGGRDLDANLAKAREARNAFFDDEAKALLEKTGLGNHPVFVKGFVRIGKVMGEAGTLPGKGAGGNTTILQNLYGSDD